MMAEMTGVECRLIHSQTDEYGSVSLCGQSVDGDIMDGGEGLRSVDFIPRQLKEEGWVTHAKYEHFGTLLDRANQWLGANPQWRIQNCESLSVNVSWDPAGYKDSTFMQNGREPCVSLLRLWVRSRGADELTFAQKVGCIHAVPKCLTPDEEDRHQVKFASYSETIAELNERLSQNPLPGKIINMETCELRFHRWSDSIDINESYWKRSENELVNYLYVVRVYYELGKPALQRIGSQAIVPMRTSSGYQESMAELLRRARLEQREVVDLLNVQSCNYGLSRMVTGSYDVVDPEKVFFPEETGPFTNFIHFIRLYFIEYNPCYMDTYELEQIDVYHKTIVPRQMIKSTFCCATDEFENIQKSMERVSRWAEASGARVLNVETIAVHHVDVTEVVANAEQTYTELCPGAWFHFYIYVYRLYIKGLFHDSLPCARVSLEESALSICSIT